MDARQRVVGSDHFQPDATPIDGDREREETAALLLGKRQAGQFANVYPRTESHADPTGNRSPNDRIVLRGKKVAPFLKRFGC